MFLSEFIDALAQEMHQQISQRKAEIDLMINTLLQTHIKMLLH